MELGVGDQIIYKNGNEYKIRKTMISGGLSVIYYTLEEPYKELQLTKSKDIRFNTLRELNYEMNKQKELIDKIIQLEFKIEINELTIEECHIEAHKIEKMKKAIKDLGIIFY